MELPIVARLKKELQELKHELTVKVPKAPEPLACMRRSGMTSRSKCASFSISQMSWRSAGPRRPAVMMLRLSLTGAPVACVR